jgi:hypothetical protein
MTIITQTVFQAGETVPIHADIKDWLGAYIDPSNGIKITLYDPSGTAIVTDGVMTQDVSGKYVYYYATTVASTKGTWSYVVTAQDGSGVGVKYTVAKGSFKLT